MLRRQTFNKKKINFSEYLEPSCIKRNDHEATVQKLGSLLAR